MNDTIKSWNKEKGFGFTGKGVFVHASTCCKHLVPWTRRGPVRGHDVPAGTPVVLTTERGDRGLRATEALCAACGAPGKWERVVTGRAVDPFTGREIARIRYDHVSGSFRDKPEADNTEYERVAALANQFREDTLHEDIFGPAEFAGVDLLYSDRSMCFVRHARCAELRRIRATSLASEKPEWFRFEKVVFRRDRDGQRIASARCVFPGDPGAFDIPFAWTRRYLSMPGSWDVGAWRAPVFAQEGIAPIAKRMEARTRQLRWFARVHGGEFAPVLAKYKARMEALKAPDAIKCDVHEGQWSEWISDDIGFMPTDECSEITVRGTVYRYSFDGLPDVVSARDPRTPEGIRAEFVAAARREASAWFAKRGIAPLEYAVFDAHE